MSCNGVISRKMAFEVCCYMEFMKLVEELQFAFGIMKVFTSALFINFAQQHTLSAVIP